MANLIQETERAAIAKRLIENPLFQETWDGMRQRYVDALMDAPIGDVDLCQDIKITIKLLDSLRSEFEETIRTGELASEQIEVINRGRRTA